jgi:hypothetical protein
VSISYACFKVCSHRWTALSNLVLQQDRTRCLRNLELPGVKSQTHTRTWTRWKCEYNHGNIRVWRALYMKVRFVWKWDASALNDSPLVGAKWRLSYESHFLIQHRALFDCSIHLIMSTAMFLIKTWLCDANECKGNCIKKPKWFLATR